MLLQPRSRSTPAIRDLRDGSQSVHYAGANNGLHHDRGAIQIGEHGSVCGKCPLTESLMESLIESLYHRICTRV